MVRHDLLGATGKFSVGRAQTDIMFNKRIQQNGTPLQGADRLVSQCMAGRTVFMYRESYRMNPQVGQLEWRPHPLPPPVVVRDFGRHPPIGPAPPVVILQAHHRLVPDLNPPLANGAPRPPVVAHGFTLRWHHKIRATMIHPNRRMHYYKHTRRGTAILAKIDRPAVAKRSFRNLEWSTQVQNWRAGYCAVAELGRLFLRRLACQLLPNEKP